MCMEGQRLLATFKEGIGMERQLKKFLSQRKKRRLRLYGFSCVIGCFFDLFSLSMLLPILSSVAAGKLSDFLVLQLAMLGVAFLGKGGFELLRRWLSIGFTEAVSQKWAVKLYRLFCEESLEEHNQTTMVQKVTAIRTDTEICADMLISSIERGVNGVILAGYFFAAAYAGYAKGCILGVCLMVTAMQIYWSNRGRILNYGERKRQSEIKESSLVAMAHSAYREIKIDTRAENLIAKYDDISKEYTKHHKEYVLMKAMSRAIISNIVQVVVLLAAAILVMAGVNQRALAASLTKGLTFIVYMTPRANQLLVEFTMIQYGRKSYDALCQNMQKYDRLQKRKSEAALLRKKEVSFTSRLRIENLTFHYPDGPDILKEVSLEVPAGSFVAIVGKSGAGKSTLLDLALGLLKPQSGSIWYDDYELTEMRDEQGPCRGEIGHIISYIPQMVYLSEDTVCNNVAFMESNKDRARVIDCLKRARVWEEIQNLPEGIDTVLGENGYTLSMGQRQRIALARALYKDVKLLVMDEVTAALDRETEREVMRSLKSLAGRKSVLLVTHHEWLAEECEQIYRLEQQRLVRVR